MSTVTSGAPAIDPAIGASTTGALGATPTPQAQRQQITNLAQEFEAMLMTQMLREMRRAMLPDESQEGGLGNETMTDTIDIQLGQALSRAGGFGLSGFLTDAFEKNLTDTKPGTAGSAAPAAPADAPEGEAPALKPPSGPISSRFGWRPDPFTGAMAFHKGIDVAQPAGTEVKAAAAGRVVAAGNYGDYGTMVVIDHGTGQQTRYAHLSASSVQLGDAVEAGQTIGRTGSTGRSTGPHLHFEVTQAGQAIDPMGPS